MLNEFLTKLKTRSFAEPNKFMVDVIVPNSEEFRNKLDVNGGALSQKKPGLLNVINNVKNPQTLTPRGVLDIASEQFLESRDVLLNPSGALTQVQNLFNNNTITPTEDSVLFRRLRFSVESAEFPGKSLATSEVSEYGPVYSMPYGQTFDQVPITFRVSADALEKKFFDAWQELIVDNETNDWNFYQNYVSTIQITQFDRSDTEIYKIRLNEAYPVTVNSMALDYNSNDEILKINVSFAYRFWKRIL